MISLALGLTPLQAQDETLPLPDLWPMEIVVPNGLLPGANNQVKVIVTNLVKNSEIKGPVKIELVAIQVDSGERTSYFAEVEGMRHGQKREALFHGVNATGSSVKLLAILDPDKVVEEADEVNNRRLYQVWIKKAPEPASPTAEDDAETEAGQPEETPQPEDASQPEEAP